MSDFLGDHSRLEPNPAILAALSYVSMWGALQDVTLGGQDAP